MGYLELAIPENIKLVAVSKTKPVEEILKIYQQGQRDFGENKVQELVNKQPNLPQDIYWHFIGHLQTNKVRFIAPFVHLIHSIDSLKLLSEVNRQALKNNRNIDCLLQIYIASEESKFGLDQTEAEELLSSETYQSMSNIRICGVMGMATFTSDKSLIRKEFGNLKSIFNMLRETYFADSVYFNEISMGMSDDYTIAIEEGSTIVRIGSAIFGKRN